MSRCLEPLKAFSGDIWGFKHLPNRFFGCLGQVTCFKQKTTVLLRVSNIGVQLLQNLLSQMIIVPKSFKAPPLASENWRGQHRSQLTLFFSAGDMKPFSGHKETPVESRTCQQSRTFKKMLCVFQLEKKQTTQLDPWKLLTLQGTKPFPLWKGKSLTQKSRLVRIYLVHVSSKVVLGKWLFHQTSNNKWLLRVPGMFLLMFLFWRSVRRVTIKGHVGIAFLGCCWWTAWTLSNGVTRLAPCSPDRWH